MVAITYFFFQPAWDVRCGTLPCSSCYYYYPHSVFIYIGTCLGTLVLMYCTICTVLLLLFSNYLLGSIQHFRFRFPLQFNQHVFLMNRRTPTCMLDNWHWGSMYVQLCTTLMQMQLASHRTWIEKKSKQRAAACANPNKPTYNLWIRNLERESEESETETGKLEKRPLLTYLTFGTVGTAALYTCTTAGMFQTGSWKKQKARKIPCSGKTLMDRHKHPASLQHWLGDWQRHKQRNIRQYPLAVAGFFFATLILLSLLLFATTRDSTQHKVPIWKSAGLATLQCFK